MEEKETETKEEKALAQLFFFFFASADCCETMNGIQELGGSFKKQNRFFIHESCNQSRKSPKRVIGLSIRLPRPSRASCTPVSGWDELLVVTAPQPVPAE